MATAKKDELLPLSSEELAKLRAQIAQELKEEIKKELLAEKEEELNDSAKNLEAQIAAQEKTLKQQLAKMPKVAIEIPEDPNNPDDVVPVGWNGIIYAIPRGRQFEVPKAIYDIWKESHEKTKAVNKRIRESITKEIIVY
jgi:seryl-tRNA synthetase